MLSALHQYASAHMANKAVLTQRSNQPGTIACAKKAENPLAKFVISGGVTIFFETFAFGHFMEVLKIAKQTSPDSYMTIARRFTATKGLAGTLDGFFPWGFGSVFGLGQATAKSMLSPPPLGMSESSAMVLSGGIGGFVQGVCMSPLLLLKTRVMTDPAFRNSGGVVATAVASARVGADVVKREGLSALMKGAPTFAMKRFADWTTRYFFVVQLENMVAGPDGKLSPTARIGCGLGGGMVSALVTIPIDVAVATIQDASKAGQKVDLIKTFREQENLFAFATRGLVARVAHVAMTTALMKAGASLVYEKLFA